MTSPVRNPVREAAEAAWAREAAVRPTVEKLAGQYILGLVTAGELAYEIAQELADHDYTRAGGRSDLAEPIAWRTDSEWF